MSSRASVTLRILAAAILVGCVGVGLFLAWVGFHSGQYLSAGNGRGTLGFFMTLGYLTPVVAAFAAIAVRIDDYARGLSIPRILSSRTTFTLLLFSTLTFAWDWLYLIVLWKA